MRFNNSIRIFCLVTIALLIILPVLSAKSNSTQWIDKGRDALREGKYYDAISFFDTAIREGADLLIAYNNKGIAELRLG